MVLAVTLPWPDRCLSPNYRFHWREKARAAAKYRRDCCIACQAVGVRALPWGGMQVHLVFCPPDNRPRDTDNMLAAMKSGLDGVADATGIDDSRWTYSMERGSPCKGGAVILTVSAPGETLRTAEMIP